MRATKTESTIPTGVWKSDPIHSDVGFAVRHMVGTFRGSFGQFEAELSDASGEPHLTGRVPVESVRVDEENLYGHLLAPDFFDSAVNPEVNVHVVWTNAWYDPATESEAANSLVDI